MSFIRYAASTTTTQPSKLLQGCVDLEVGLRQKQEGNDQQEVHAGSSGGNDQEHMELFEHPGPQSTNQSEASGTNTTQHPAPVGTTAPPLNPVSLGELGNIHQESVSTGSENAEVRYLCKTCKKEYSQAKSFSNHQCFSKFKKIACPSCSKLISKSNMSHHLKVHSATNHKCVRCNKTFKDVRALTNHMEKHNMKQNSKCDVCGKSFTRPSHLNKHMMIHTKEKIRKKDTICKHCKEKFGSFSALKVHLKANHKELAVKCNLCHKLFFSDRGMRDHKKIHTMEERTVAVSEEQTVTVETSGVEQSFVVQQAIPEGMNLIHEDEDVIAYCIIDN